MTQANALLGLLAETSLHAGAGQSVGAIDLPIQREAHSDWPCVYGSAVKGALRARAEEIYGPNNSSVQVIFGPDTRRASEHAGALAVGDARLLLLPVRSFTGHFRWATCPALLRRLRRDCERLGIALGGFEVPAPERSEALVPEGDGDLFLEEYRFAGQACDLRALIQALSRLIPDEDAPALLARQLAIVHDDLFVHLARHTTPVAAHVRIDNRTKTVAEGALWYEESLPPDTMMYVALSAWDARKAEARMDAFQVLDGVLSGLFRNRPYLQLGGNETVGMGWCKVAIAKGE